MSIRITQIPTEVLALPDTVPVRVTQVPTETLYKFTPNLRFTQVPVEVVTKRMPTPSFQSELSGNNIDYFRYLFGPLTKTDRSGDAWLLDFSLAPHDGSFVKLVRGDYIRVGTERYGLWFTGYVTKNPELEYLGKDNDGSPVWGYRYEATGDEYILNLKPLGLLPPYRNTTQGAVLKDLVQRAAPGVFSVGNIADGAPVARYAVSPDSYFSDVVREFCTTANYQLISINRVLYFRSKDAYAFPFTVDATSKHFTPLRLSIQPSAEPLVNDVVVLGDAEPQARIKEYFVGDGYTARFPLISSVYGTERTVLLDEVFSSSQVDEQKWDEYDNVSDYIQVSNGYLNVLGGTDVGAYDVFLRSKALIPLESHLRITHGEYDFVSASSGVVGGLWTQDPSPALAGCVFGLLCQKSGGDTVINPVVNGVADDTKSLTIDTTKRYVFRTTFSAKQFLRLLNTYSYITQGGERGVYGGTSISDDLACSTQITRIDPLTGEVEASTVWECGSIGVAADSLYANYIPVAGDDLHVALTGITISRPVQVTLEKKAQGDSEYSTLSVGPNELDAMDGMSPAAAISEEGTAPARDSLLIPAKYNPTQTSLQFFKDSSSLTTSVPQVGDIIKVGYRRRGAASARVQDSSSIATEAAKWGDDGLRSLVRTDLIPAPRSSEECELAAAALLEQFGHQHYEGTYTQPTIDNFTAEPRSGGILPFSNLPPTDFPDLTAEEVSEIKTTLLTVKPVEIYDHAISFGRLDRVSKVLAGLAYPKDNLEVKSDTGLSTVVNLEDISTSYIGDVLAASLSSWSNTEFTFDTGQTAPVGGGFEVRYTDEGWGASDGKNLVLRTSNQTFTVPRNKRSTVVFIKAYDAGELYSRCAACVRVVFPLVPPVATDCSGYLVDSNKLRVSFTLPGSGYQDIYKLVIRDVGTQTVYGEIPWDGITFQYNELELVYGGLFTSDFTIEFCTYNLLGETASSPPQVAIDYADTTAVPTGLVLEERTKADGLDYIKASWDAITDPYVTTGGRVETQWKQAGLASSASSTKSPGTAASGSGSSYVWSNPNNAKTEDGSFSTVTLVVPPGNTKSNALELTNFAFAVPSTATIKGARVRVKAKQSSGTSAVYLSEIKLLGVTNTRKYDVSGNPWSGTLGFRSYGSAVDLWKTAGGLTPAVVNGSSFGISLEFQCTGVPGNGAVVAVDFVEIALYYTVPDDAADDVWISSEDVVGSGTFSVSGPVIGGPTAYVHVRAVNRFGITSDWVEASIVPVGSGALLTETPQYFGSTPSTSGVTTSETSDPPVGNLVTWDEGGMIQDGGTLAPAVHIVGIAIDGGGSAIVTPITRRIQYPFADGEIIGWSAAGSPSGDISVEVDKHASSAPPSAPSIPNTSTDKISASAPIVLSSSETAAGGTAEVSTWTKSVARWDSIQFNVVTASTLEWAEIYLLIQES